MTYREAEPTDKVTTPSASSVLWLYEPEKLFIEGKTWFDARTELCRIHHELDPMEVGDTLRLCTTTDIYAYKNQYQNRELFDRVDVMGTKKLNAEGLAKKAPVKKAKKKAKRKR